MGQIKVFIVFVGFALMTIPAVGQIKAVEHFLSQDDNIQKFYVYQSSLRMLNTKGDDAFNQLIKDIRKINVYISEDAPASTSEKYTRMIKDLSKDDFEVLVSVKNNDMHLNLMGKDTEGDRAYYVLAETEGNSFAVFEMDGKLDLRYLESVKTVNFEKLQQIVGQKTGSDSEKTNTEDR